MVFKSLLATSIIFASAIFAESTDYKQYLETAIDKQYEIINGLREKNDVSSPIYFMHIGMGNAYEDALRQYEKTTSPLTKQ